MSRVECLVYINSDYVRPDHFRHLEESQLEGAIRATNEILILLQKEQAHRDYQRADKLLSRDEPKVSKVKLGSIR